MSTRSLLLSALLLVGCDVASPPGLDGGPARDAALADGGGLLDAGIAPRDAGRDAGASDAGPSGLCWSAACDPRVPDCTGGSCVLWGEASTCESTPGSYAANARCETVMDCTPGLACFLGSDGYGVCGRVCCPGDGAACVDGAVCGGSGLLVDGTPTSWGRCLPPRSCSLLRPEETCDEREGCYIVDTERTTECRVAGPGGPGDSCAAQTDCQAGFFCGGLPGAQRCVRICRLEANECPTAEGRCVAQRHSPEGTGFCTVDMLTGR